VAFRFNSVVARDERIDIRTGAIARTAPATKKKDAAKIGIGAGAGAVIGGIVGGGDGAAKGAVIGGAGGTGVVLATRGEEVTVPAGASLSVRLLEPITVRVPITR
jgi:outer membrane lipoprotein SlyB